MNNTISPLYGAIIGDIIGSSYEGRTVRKKDFKLFTRFSRFTDDTVMTIAVADCISHAMTDSLLVAKMFKTYVRLYPEAGYGDYFMQWATSEDSRPYDSNGNGAAMRISPVAFLLYAIPFSGTFITLTNFYTKVTHNNKSVLDSAFQLAFTISLMAYGYSKDFLRFEFARREWPNLNKTVRQIRDERDKLSFDCSSETTVIHAIIAFLESNSFEDAIRNAVYIGGDSDTIASMCGAIAAAYYKEIPQSLFFEAKSRLNNHFLEVIHHYDHYCRSVGSPFEIRMGL